MADKAINELVAATQVTPTDLFVLQQAGTAKKLDGQTLENWLVSFADGHGGIQSIVKHSTSGLEDTYRITLADTTTFDFVVTNGRSITDVSKVDTSDLVDTYRIAYNDGTSSTFTVTNGAKGDKGDNAYVWIRYASQQPTESSHDFGVLPDDWMGIYSGNSAEAPTDWQVYQWFQIKGEKGNTGNPATVLSFAVEYLASDSGTIIPSGSWQQTVPAVAQGRYLWTRITIRFNTGDPIVAYSVSRYGIDGSGAVSTVNQKSPDSNGNVQLAAADVGALPISGDTMTGPLSMGGNRLSDLPEPEADTDAANKAYADSLVKNVPTPTEDGHAANKGYVDSFRPVLLWENASPTSTFGAQTVTVDLSGYTFVFVQARNYNNAPNLVNCMVRVGDAGMLVGAVNTAPACRMFTSSESSLVFSSSEYMYDYDEACIPVKIYGIK